MSDATQKGIEDLLKAVNDASGSARALFVTLMVIALYFLIVVSGTDDMALLRNATVAVPTLSNATLPARAFYICAPLVFVFLHLDLLIHLKLLSDKLYRYNELLEASGLDEAAVRDYRLRLAGFPFSNWLGSDRRTGRIAYALQGAIVWITLVLLPLTVLLAMQLGFLAYQSEAVTWLHRVALIIDAGLLLYFWEAFQRGRYQPPDPVREQMRVVAREAWREWIDALSQERVRARRARATWWWNMEADRSGSVKAALHALSVLRHGATAVGAPLVVALLLAAVFGLWGSGYGGLSIGLAFFCLIVGARVGPLPSSLMLALRQSFGDMMAVLSSASWKRWPVFLPFAVPILVSLTVATIPDEPADHTSRWLYSWMEGDFRDAERQPAAEGLSSDELDMQFRLIRDSLEPGTRPLDAESLERLASARCAMWLALRMPGMPDPDELLSDAPDSRSALAFHLENANRMPGEMRASCPTIALFHLKGGWFHRTLTVTGKVVARSDIRPDLAKELRASLRDYRYRARAELREGRDAGLANKYDDLVAQIEGLDLSERSLRWADFTGAAFPKAVLDRAQLQHATLTSSDLRKVELKQAWLTGSNMGDVTLTGADISRATLTGTDMSGATLTGANMSGATLTGADMSGATLTGANMSHATLIGANMSGATLTGADMDRAALTGADMSHATLIGTSMVGATLTGADMFGALLTGANMWRAFARGAVFPNETERLRGMPIGGLETGRYSEGDIESAVAELTHAGTLVGDESLLLLSAALGRLETRINQATDPEHFTDCIGGAPCGDDDTRQRQSALERAAHFETLICSPNTRGKGAGPKDSGSAAEGLVELLRSELVGIARFSFSANDPDKIASEKKALEYLRLAAEDTMHRLATRRCAPPEAQALIDDWARKNPPSTKAPLP